MIDFRNIVSWAVRGAFCLVLGVGGGLFPGSAQAQEIKSIIEASATKINAVGFDVPVPIKLDWPPALKKKIDALDFRNIERTLREIERTLRVYARASRQKPMIDRYNAAEVNEAGWFVRPLEAALQDVVTCPLSEFRVYCDDKWVNVTEKTSLRADASGLYAVLSRLHANRYYQFAFVIQRDLTKKEEQAFKKVARGKLDRAFRKENVTITKDEDYRKILRAMVRAVEEAAGERIVVFKKGSILDTTRTDDVKRIVDGIDLATKINDATDNRKIHAADADDTDPSTNTIKAWHDAEAALRNFGHTETLLAIHGVLGTLKLEEPLKDSTANPYLDQLHQLSERVLAVLIDEHNLFDGENAWLLATGRKGLQSSGTLTPTLDPMLKVWSTDELKARKENRKKTIEALSTLYVLVNQVKSLKAQGRSIPIAMNEFDALLLKIRATQRLLRAVDTDDPLEKELSPVRRELTKRETAFDMVLDKSLQKIREENAIYALPITTSNFKTRANWHISADVGVLHAPTINETSLYLGVNFYLRPVNKEASLRSFGFWSSLPRRVAVMVGVTTQSVKSDQREDLIAGRAVVVGLGIRITDTIRLSGGALIFKQRDPNPLVNDLDVTSSAFISLSLDWDVKDTLGGIGNIFK